MNGSMGVFRGGFVIAWVLASATFVSRVGAQSEPAPDAATNPDPARVVAPPPTPPGYPPQGAVRFAADVASAVDVKRVPAGLVLVRPKVNGHEPGWFIFDTGAGIGVISTPRVEGLDLRSDGTITASGVGTQEATIRRADEFVLGPIVLLDLPMIEIDLSFLTAPLGEEIAGIVGYGLLSRCVAEIDAAAPSIALFDPSSYHRPDTEWTPASFEKFIPLVRGTFEGREGSFTLDTGANDGLSFHARAVKEFDLLADRETTDSKLGGVGGVIATKRGTISSFAIGGLALTEFPATFEVESKSGADPGATGNVGMGVLKERLLITDYARGRVAFAPRR
jgi:hypothetical protein